METTRGEWILACVASLVLFLHDLTSSSARLGLCVCVFVCFVDACCIFFSFYNVVLLKFISPSPPSCMPMSPCPTTWASRASSSSWSMRMITGPSSANRCTTSAFQKTRLLVLHCSASGWVPSHTRAAFSVIYSGYNTPRVSHLVCFTVGVFLTCLRAYSVCIWVLITETQACLKTKKNVFMPKLWSGLKQLFIACCKSTFLRKQRMCFTILSPWLTFSCENALTIYLQWVFYVSSLLSCYP